MEMIGTLQFNWMVYGCPKTFGNIVYHMAKVDFFLNILHRVLVTNAKNIGIHSGRMNKTDK